jgi:viroplasmin and RNaseH domain-containing protein
MIDYKKLGRLFDSGDQTKIDTVINVDHRPLVSQYDNRFIKFGFVEHKDNKYILKMTKKERDIFQITKSIADDELKFAYDVISKILSDNTEENLRKEIELVREDAQIEILRRDKINNEHQKLNGELRVKLKDETERRKFAENELALIKGIGNNSPEVRNLKAELKEVKADNKKLAEMNDKLTHTPNRLRKKGLL